MNSKTTTGERRPFRLRLLALVLLSAFVGCNHKRYFSEASLTQPILPPPSVPDPVALSSPKPTVQQAAYVEPTPSELRKAPEEIPPAPTKAPLLTGSRESIAGPQQTLALPDAIALSFRLQPRLRASLESIQQARGREDIAFAAFLPVLTTAYSVGDYDLSVGGTGIPISGLPGSQAFTFLPPGGALPIGLNIQAGYELAELRLQWLVCDFGRRTGLYNQAGLASDIAQLQTDRAYQTVANEVATAYYQVLRVKSLRRIAEESVRRATDDLDVAGKLAKGGVIEREKVLRAQVALAQAQQSLDVAEEAEGISVAALNLAIGLNISAPTVVIDTTDVPPFGRSLADCLQSAVGERREFQVARKSVQVAQEGSRVARADFAPRIVAEGYLNDFEQTNHTGRADLGLGFIKLEWGLFEGGKRIAELQVEGSRIREALAQADTIADTIAFQVNQAYRQLTAARKGIDRSRPAVEQTKETYRLVSIRSLQGDATPAELTDAEASLTRAQQDYYNAIYDYLTALARLDYAMGVTPSPARPGP